MSDLTLERILSIRRRLADWYSEYGRELPWRRDVTPYRVLVSEMMLVQTTVTAVIPYFERFLDRFPDPHSLAAASEDDVLKVWEGLGYYRRARQLHAAARMMVSRYGGSLPPDPQAIRALPGVGPYMAGAILSFAFDQSAPILEANSQRVLARLLAYEGEVGRAAARKALWSAAAALVPATGAGDFNQALMDLGATICTPRTPNCLICPLREPCKARQAGLQDKLPKQACRPAVHRVMEASALVADAGRLLMVRREEGGLWSRFWEFPTVHVSGMDPARRVPGAGRGGLTAGIQRLTGIRARILRNLGTLSYTVTRHRVTVSVHLARLQGGELVTGPGLESVDWAKVEDLDLLPLTAPARKLATRIREEPAWMNGISLG